jgi:hypothetical protein
MAPNNLFTSGHTAIPSPMPPYSFRIQRFKRYASSGFVFAAITYPALPITSIKSDVLAGAGIGLLWEFW